MSNMRNGDGANDDSSDVASSRGESGGPISTTPSPVDKPAPDAGDKPAEPVANYSVFSKRRKRCIVLSASACAVFSTFTSQAYLPALKVIADDFDVSVSKINLTITIYLVFQGITPMFIGAFADRLGRRPAYLICFVVYLAANIGLAEAPNYGTLLGVRCLQAAGISGTQSLCQAVVADVITSAERGEYIGFITLSAILGPSLGPIIGGGLTDGLGWRSIFWFLAICSGILFLLLLLFFPETCRPIVGDGSIRPPTSNETLWNIFMDRRRRKHSTTQFDKPSTSTEKQASRPTSTFALKHLFTSLALLWNKELGLLLAYGGLIYSGINAVSAAMPSLLTEIYGYNSLEIGLLFLPIAGGSFIGVFGVGRVIDWNYRRHARRLGLVVENKRQIDLATFPIEQARLELVFVPLYVTAAVVIGWGWALESRTTIAVPCVLGFVLGAAYIGVLNVFNTLITDLYRKKAGAAVAANWFVRCMMGAVMTAVIQPLILAVNPGWAYTIMGAAYVVFSPVLLLIMRKGMDWRRQEREREERRLAAKATEDVEDGLQEKKG